MRISITQVLNNDWLGINYLVSTQKFLILVNMPNLGINQYNKLRSYVHKDNFYKNFDS